MYSLDYACNYSGWGLRDVEIVSDNSRLSGYQGGSKTNIDFCVN